MRKFILSFFKKEEKRTCLNCSHKPEDIPFTLWCNSVGTCIQGEKWKSIDQQ